MPRHPLPMRDGVAPSYLSGGRLARHDQLSGGAFPDVSEAAWRDRMARGDVVDGDGKPLPADSRFKRGLRIFYYRELERRKRRSVQGRDPVSGRAPGGGRQAALPAGDSPGRFLHETCWCA
jgi:hypothetical protein